MSVPSVTAPITVSTSAAADERDRHRPQLVDPVLAALERDRPDRPDQRTQHGVRHSLGADVAVERAGADQHDAGEPDEQPDHLGRAHRLAEQPPGQHGHQQRLEVDQHRRQPGRQRQDRQRLQGEERPRRSRSPSTACTGQVRRRSGGPDRAQATTATTRPPSTERSPPNTQRRRVLQPDLDRGERRAPRQHQQRDADRSGEPRPRVVASTLGVDTDVTVGPDCVIVTES